VTTTPTGDLSNETALSTLATGLVIVTTTTGALSTYAGAPCTNQFIRSLNASGAATCASVTLSTDTTGDYVAGVTSNQGLLKTGTEAATLGLIDCAANEVLKRNAGDTAWVCDTDDTGAGGSDATAIHDDTANEIANITAKATPIGADYLLLEDSAAANAKKSITVSSLEAALEAVVDLQDLQGAVTDTQVPNTITVNLATSATSATSLSDGDKGDFSCTGGTCTLDANSIALTTDTTGDYVSGVTSNQGLLKTGTEGATLGLIDCAANEVLKRNAGDTAWACAVDEQGAGGTDSTAIHDDTGNEIAPITAKTAPVGADVLLLEDSAAGYAKKSVTLTNLTATLASTTLTVVGASDTVQATLRAAAVQTANIQEWEASDTTVLASVGTDGTMTATLFSGPLAFPATATTTPDITTDVLLMADDTGATSQILMDDLKTAFAVPEATVGATFPLSPTDGQLFLITTASAVDTCDAGASPGVVQACRYNATGLEWEPVALSGATSPTLDQVITTGRATTALTSFASAVRFGDSANQWRLWCDGAGVCSVALCPTAATLESQCYTTHHRARDVDILFRNTDNATCWQLDKATMAVKVQNPGGSCPNAFPVTGTLAVTGAITATTDITATGELRGKSTPVIPGVDTYTMLSSDCGTTVGNTDADALEVDLIADPTGCVVCFFTETTQVLTLDPNSTDTFVVNGLTPSAGQSLQLAAGIGHHVCLQGKNTSTWWVFPGTGTLTLGS
jgi:hypothetical protein